ncbi:MAG: prepilin-type N-terminal cleavage/methylation domain-containing protein [Candidatus Levybacteria bacterium]|nr:prepilin-type N-terminal cleavage/methylation domain-containing protein [Candidatus Levybacteria bacterium]
MRKHLSSFIFHLSSRKGFTLIELLVAISIIGVLSSFLLANFVGVRQRARDGVRKSDLRQIQSALELYRSDKGAYPLTASFPSCSSQFTDGATPPVIYMQKIPCDPTNAGQYIYTYSLSGSTYNLYACLENVNDSQKDSSNNSTYCTGGTTNWSYTLQNP